MLKQRSIPRETPGRGGERGAKSTIATGFDLPDRQCAHICNRRVSDCYREGGRARVYGTVSTTEYMDKMRSTLLSGSFASALVSVALFPRGGVSALKAGLRAAASHPTPAFSGGAKPLVGVRYIPPLAGEQTRYRPLANRVNPAPPSSRLAWRGKAEMFPLVTFCPKQEDKSHHRTAVREIGCRQPGGTDRRTEAARPWYGDGLSIVRYVSTAPAIRQ
ncbi:hypothetical protein CIRG_10247 [Coccidioides immitis RMSCC 2394]|uniref:Uncharacterized protein n=1 Tax=Coccidioides immitis RMSCC 2394 TaxID=404692 RepID=A0A0J6Y5T9_COCIT|nr:hypothetical protein CIRG_10247 [Coccidioides immitis RMSCC 2394]